MLIIGAILTAGYMAQAGVHFVLSLYSGRAGSQEHPGAAASAYFAQGVYLSIPASFILLLAWYRRKTLGTGILLAFSVAVALYVTVRRGDRTFILELSLPLLVLFYLRRGRRPRALAVLASFIALIVVANVEATLRQKETRHGQSASAVIANAIVNPGHELVKFIKGADPSEFTVLSIEANQYQLGTLHYRPGSTVGSLLAGWIPHQFVHKKPWTPLQYVSWTLFPETVSAGSYGPTMFGAMFADYGWVTLVLYSLALGAVLRGIWEYFRRGVEVGGVQLMYAALLPLVIIMLRNDIDDIFYRSIFLVFPLIWCVRVCSRPPRRVRVTLARMRLAGRNQPAESAGTIPARSALP
jgi:hypothetical protein